MNIRGVVALKLGSQVFLRPYDCTCDKCERLALTQAQLLIDVDTLKVGDKLESYRGQMFYRVENFTDNQAFDDDEEDIEAFEEIFGKGTLDFNNRAPKNRYLN